MPLYVLIARDRPDAGDLRAATRQAHLDWLSASDGVRMAGPLLAEDGAMTGSLLVIEAADRAAALTWAGGDPYREAGLFTAVEVIGWKKVIG